MAYLRIANAHSRDSVADEEVSNWPITTSKYYTCRYFSSYHISANQHWPIDAGLPDMVSLDDAIASHT